MQAAHKVLAVVALGAMLSGCGSSSDQGPRGVARAFTEAVLHHDGATACRQLAPGTRSELVQSESKPCATAILDEKLPDPGSMGGSDVFGTMAQVRFASDTVFVARFKSGWKVMAAGCKPVPGHPYDCRLQGG